MSLRTMNAAGLRGAIRYPLLLGALYLIQLIVSGLAGLVVARGLAAVLADHTLIDLAAAGDLPALVKAIQASSPALATALWACLSAVLLYALISWATTAGFIAVLQRRPVSRQHTAEVFGAGAATHVFAFARLWLWCLVPYAIVGATVVVGLALGLGDLHQLSFAELAGDVLPPMMPGLLLWWMVNTAVDYARVDLVRRHDKSAIRALLRGFAEVFTSPWPLPHAAIYYLVFFGTTALYWNATAGVEMTAAGYFLIRQALALTRFLAKAWLIGGQVALHGARLADRDD